MIIRLKHSGHKLTEISDWLKDQGLYHESNWSWRIDPANTAIIWFDAEYPEIKTAMKLKWA